jgi:hypothetical protein
MLGPVSEITTAPVKPSAPEYTPEQAAAAFSTSVMISGVRCLFAYVLLPWVLPALGVAGDWGPWLGLIVGPIAIVFNVLSIRRFHRSGHKWRWPITVINVTIIVLLVVLMVRDIATILS